ncbi:MAG: TRAP transporter small permease [Burkholderiaceae bacterium]
MNAAATPHADGSLLQRLPVWLAAASLFAMMVMTFFDVVLRSVANNPIESATELTRLFMGIIVFSCLPTVSWRNGHIVVDLLDKMFGPSAARLRDSLIDLVCGALLFLPGKRVIELAERSRSYGDLTEYLQIPTFYIGWFIGISVIMTAIVLLVRAVARFVRPQWVPQSVNG